MGILNLFNMTKHNKWLKRNGLSVLADRNESQIKYNQHQDVLLQKMKKAEELSKSGNISDSLDILTELQLQGDFEQPARLYERLAINYRKIKDYDKEIEVITEFLSTQQSKYGKDMWIDHFQTRLEKAELLKNK
ncbi:hypothetical protein VNN36_04490 [Lactococcus garvieae]|uniref:hypothetical protein n=1 Tax=Lactococcus garvieae TaxID=1363 RepID=UPI0030D52968